MKRTNPLTLFIAIALSIICIFLGFWQLNRASDLKNLKKVTVDAPAVAIEKLAKPNSNLNGKAANRLVILRGTYVKNYLAPNQSVKENGLSKRETLEVRLLKLNSGGAVLVVRGIAPINDQSISGEVKVEGRLYPRQSADLAKVGGNNLTRLDPSLIVGDTQLNLIDGYVIATSEKTALGERITATRIPADRQLPKVAGYYWQHITYVGIWWLFALLVLIAPFYDRLRERRVKVG